MSRWDLNGSSIDVTTISVLVIDDEEDMRELTRFALEMGGGFSVSTASSGLEGIQLARSSAPGVILLDWMMPEMDGPATIAALRREPSTSEIPVVFLTGMAHGGGPVDFGALGAAGAIAKPFDPMTLAQQVSALLRSCQP